LLSVQIIDLLDLTLPSPTDKISIDQKEIEMITRQAGIARCTVLLTVGRYLKGS
jgi:hypothetical protein